MDVEEEFLASILSHHGVKGQKWGVRRTDAQLSRASGTPAKPGSDDHEKVTEIKTKARTTGVKSLSNAELKALNERMNLEQQYSNLSNQQATINKGHNKVRQIMAISNTAVSALRFSQSLQSLISGV